MTINVHPVYFVLLGLVMLFFARRLLLSMLLSVWGVVFDPIWNLLTSASEALSKGWEMLDEKYVRRKVVIPAVPQAFFSVPEQRCKLCGDSGRVAAVGPVGVS